MEAGMGVLGDRAVLPGGAALVTRAGRLMAGIREDGQAARRLWARARWPGRSRDAVAGAAAAAAAEAEHPPRAPDPPAGGFFAVANTPRPGGALHHHPRTPARPQ